MYLFTCSVIKWPFANNKVQLLYRGMFRQTGNWLINVPAINASCLSASARWGAAAQRWLLYQIAFGSEKCTKKKKTSRSREATAGNALHIVYSLHCLIRLITLPVLLARAQRQAHKHKEFEGLRVCRYNSVNASRRAQPSTKMPAECNYRLRLLVNLPVLTLVSSL